MMTLYNYFRSSAAFRVRIALNLKGLAYESIPIHLTRDGGKQFTPEYRAVNPQMRVPTLVLPGGELLIQSLAIMEYLNEVYPEPPLLPAEPLARARVRAVAQIIACDIHPLDNVAPLNFLRREFKLDEAAVNAWYAHWVKAGFDAVEALIEPGLFAFGSYPTLADLCLVPQVFNARRFKISLDPYPKIAAAAAAADSIPAFVQARPENQPDAE